MLQTLAPAAASRCSRNSGSSTPHSRSWLLFVHGGVAVPRGRHAVKPPGSAAALRASTPSRGTPRRIRSTPTAEDMAPPLFPFTALRLRPPKLHLPDTPDQLRPSASAVFLTLLAFFFVVSSGIIYDVMVEPKSMGETKDPSTGVARPEAFMPYRLNGQYSVEGLAAGFVFTVGAVGFIMLDRAHTTGTGRTMRRTLLIGGSVLIAGTFQIALLFMRMKLPHYMAAHHS